MKLLAVESSAAAASVAVFDDKRLVAEYFIDHKKTHSQTLLPMVDEVMILSDTEPSELDAVAVTSGPGSFTGLRIGATIAKGLCMALDIPLIPVPTLDALAYNASLSGGIVCPVMDARRNQVYTGLYSFENGIVTKLMDSSAMDIQELLSFINQKHTNEKVTFLGDGVPVFKDVISAGLGERACFAPENLSIQKAGSVGLLALRLSSEGKSVNADDFSPNYLRQSQAEREYTEIKILSDEEIPFVADLDKECFTDSWSEQSLKSHMANRVNGGLVAFHKGEPCGYVLFQKVSGEGELFRIAVSEKYRRAGIGMRLMTAMEDDAHTDFWSLEVRSGNTAAIKLYEKIGYRASRVRQDYYSEPVEDALIMEHFIRQ